VDAAGQKTPKTFDNITADVEVIPIQMVNEA